MWILAELNIKSVDVPNFHEMQQSSIFVCNLLLMFQIIYFNFTLIFVI